MERFAESHDDSQQESADAGTPQSLSADMIGSQGVMEAKGTLSEMVDAGKDASDSTARDRQEPPFYSGALLSGGEEYVEESGTVTTEELQSNDDRTVDFGDPEDYGFTQPEYDL